MVLVLINISDIFPVPDEALLLIDVCAALVQVNTGLAVTVDGV